jgi:superfamily I DNA/RNA helicase
MRPQFQTLRALKDDYLLDEIEWVIEGRGLSCREHYLAAERTGRQVRLTAAQREQLWDLNAGFSAALAAERRYTTGQVRNLAWEAIKSKAHEPPYDYVFVDEAQDLTPVGLRVLFGLCRNPENVCLAADTNQSVYARGFGRHIFEGLSFQGRSIVLGRGYRTTREIAAAASAVLAGRADSDPESLAVEGGPAGEIPILHSYATPGGHARAIKNFLNSARLRARVDWSGAAVLCPTNRAVDAMAALLRSVGVPTAVVRRAATTPGKHVAVMTIHTAKGLEYPMVVVANLRAGEFPRAGPSMSSEEREEEDAHCRRLLFVAATRAMRELLVTVPSFRPTPIFAGVGAGLWRRTFETDLDRAPAAAAADS